MDTTQQLREATTWGDVLSEGHLASVLQSDCEYFNRAWPHQGIGQRTPERLPEREAVGVTDSVEEIPILGDLHHEYRPAA